MTLRTKKTILRVTVWLAAMAFLFWFMDHAPSWSIWCATAAGVAVLYLIVLALIDGEEQ